jgi:AmmeMemoRadiSam system protein B
MDSIFSNSSRMEGAMIRIPAVASQFYPGEPSTLQRTLQEIVPEGPTPKKKALAVVSPHAGYIYSGSVAGQTFAQVAIPSTCIIMGPNHHGRGAEAALMASGVWRMPLGDVAINEKVAQSILANSQVIREDARAHELEHSLEVQVPFLQYLQPSLSIVPICLSVLSYEDCKEIGSALARTVSEFEEKILLVASSDMSHYESREEASRKDKMAIDRVLDLDPEGLYSTVFGKRISMCGIIPATIALIAALKLGCQQGELVRYTDSGEVSGDIDQVVGYAGLVLS